MEICLFDLDGHEQVVLFMKVQVISKSTEIKAKILKCIIQVQALQLLCVLCEFSEINHRQLTSLIIKVISKIYSCLKYVFTKSYNDQTILENIERVFFIKSKIM